jgi:CubicO group peptidase (beta-lactamase class C family)
MRPERVAHARDLCARWVQEGHTTALSVCVVRRGVIVLHEAFGRLRPEPDAPPLATDSLFPISSLTKPITATLAMQLVEDGLLGLNRPARDYLPELTGDGAAEILVHHLLTHTSGYVWYDDEPIAAYTAQRLRAGFTPPPCPETQHPTVNALLHLYYDAPLAVTPGTEMIYADVNYQFVGEIVRRLSGRRVWALAHERVFAPLGMDDSSFIVPESAVARVVLRPPDAPLAAPISPLYQGIDSRQVQETPYAGGGVFSTPLDMAKFGQCFLNGGMYGDVRLLSRATVDAMTRDQIPGVPARFLGNRIPIASWGYGWTVESPAKWKYYHGSLWPLGTFNHGGGGGVMLWVDREHEVVGAYFEACLRATEKMEMLWNADLFQNVITAAVDD